MAILSPSRPATRQGLIHHRQIRSKHTAITESQTSTPDGPASSRVTAPLAASTVKNDTGTRHLINGRMPRSQPVVARNNHLACQNQDRESLQEKPEHAHQFANLVHALLMPARSVPASAPPAAVGKRREWGRVRRCQA